MREVQAMLREMRYRSCVGQKKLADKEKTEAEKCKFIHAERNTRPESSCTLTRVLFISTYVAF